jgi:GNAT superfamily N-acetyltransferase
MAIEIRKVRTESEASAIFRLRYEVYVEELGRSQRYADHAARSVAEPLDTGANLFCAYDGARLVGTVRTNYAWRSRLEEYEALYQLERCGSAYPHGTSVTTKLVVAPDQRGSTLPYRLAAATYAAALADGVSFDFVDVYPARVPFFQRLGYQVHLPRAVHPEYGPVIVMRLGMRDAQHLAEVRSPFLRVLLRASRVAA